MKQPSSSIVTLALILASGGTSLIASAQTAADKFPLPTSVPAGTKVQINGSSSMQAVNQGLKERFQKQFPDADVTVPTQYQGSDSGINAIAAGKADLAGIGRPLTKAEQAKGIAAKTIGRSKIAIIVGEGNPYKGNLTLKDFAKIYRGEVTDWSQLPSANGATGKIKVIDRPETSDTRRAFANYLVFQNGKLRTGSNAEKLTEDSTQAVVDKLGVDGISYAPADQIKNIPGIRAVTLHSTQPDNPKYPFSQPLSYAYKNQGDKVSNGAKAFLGYVSDPSGQTAIQETIASGATTATGGATTTPTTSTSPATTTTTTETTGTAGTTGATGSTGTTTGNATGGDPSATTTTTTTTTSTADKGGFPWWVLLIPLGAGLLWWLLGRKKPEEEAAPRSAVTTAPEQPPGLKPLYPPPPSRTARADGLSGDLSGDLSSSIGGFRPADDLRSGDLRSGDLSGTLPPRPNLNLNAPNANFNGVVDTVKDKANDINLAGGAAIAGGAAAAAAFGKNIFDRANEPVGDITPPEITPPEIAPPDLSNPLEGLQDKSSNLLPNLDLQNPLDGVGERVSETIADGGANAAALGGAALAGGAALVGGAGSAIGNFFDRDQPESSDLSFEVPNDNPLAGGIENIQDRAEELIPDGNIDFSFDEIGDLTPDGTPENPLDRVSEFLKDSGAAAAAAGGTAIAGGAALAGGAGQSIGNFFGGGQKEEDISSGLWPEESGDRNDPFALSDPLDAVQDKAAELKDNVMDLDLPNPLDAMTGKAAELKDNVADAIPDGLEIDNNPLGDLTDKAGNFFSGTGAAVGAAGAATLAGGAALFGQQKPEISELEAPNLDLDTFDRDLNAIDFDNLDDDPFAGLSDLLGEETGDIEKDSAKSETSGFFDNLSEKTTGFLDNAKDMGGAALAGGAAGVAGAGQAFQSFFTAKEQQLPDRSGEISGNLLYGEGQITLVSAHPTQAYTHWEIPVRLKRQLREQGGQKLVVRLYDVTDVDPNAELPHNFQEFECNDSDWDLELPIAQSNRRYVTEIGYVTDDNRWLMLARSVPLWIRSTPE
jgi:ABC-type phosphate transport system substrate-binding protein